MSRKFMDNQKNHKEKGNKRSSKHIVTKAIKNKIMVCMHTRQRDHHTTKNKSNVCQENDNHARAQTLNIKTSYLIDTDQIKTTCEHKLKSAYGHHRTNKYIKIVTYLFCQSQRCLFVIIFTLFIDTQINFNFWSWCLHVNLVYS